MYKWRQFVPYKNKEDKKANGAAYYANNREAKVAYATAYGVAHPEQRKASRLRRRVKIMAHNKIYYAEHPVRCGMATRICTKCGHTYQPTANFQKYCVTCGHEAYLGKERKHNAKHRTLGFTPLNSWFSGCEGHHINKSDVIYLPRKLHRSISHNQWTGRNMDKINALAGQYLTEDWT
jgi:hypothetical protein